MQVPGYNFLGGDPADTQDVLGHGTAVAGAASAMGNSGIGVSGVTWNNPVMPLVTATSSNTGLVIVASAGNYASSDPIYPAALNNVVGVSATDQYDNLAGWSSYGSSVDVSAPGLSIYTTANGGGYRYASGTSFSSPITAGLAGLIFSLNPSLTNSQVVDLIKTMLMIVDHPAMISIMDRAG